MKTLETQHDWTEKPDVDLPSSLADCAKAGHISPEKGAIQVRISVLQWPHGKEYLLRVRLEDTLLDIMQAGAKSVGLPLLPPPPHEPLDFLRSQKRHGGGWSQPLTELKTPLWLVLVKEYSRSFAIEFRRAVKINAQWGIAPTPEITPRDLETLFGFDPEQFSLYRANSNDFLPPDTPLSLKRSDCFEAQKDGKYGFR